MIKLTIIESAADKDLYDDLYSYADEYRMTSRWTKDNVEKYLKRQKDFRRMSDADFDKVVAKVNKDFKRKKKVKSDPYSETSYKIESKRFNISKRLHEQDVEIEVKHEGILEVPEGKNVDDLPFSHFEKLAKKKGLSKITKALNNLQVWNKNDDPKLSKWAGNMIDKLTDKLGKKESLVRESLDWEIVHESDDDDGKPTLWSAKVNSHHYGKFMWIELSDVDGYYDLVYNAGGDRYKTIKSFMSFNRAKKFAEDLIRQEKIEYDEIDESVIKEGTKGFSSPVSAADYFYNYGNFAMWPDQIRDKLKKNGYDDDFISDTFEIMYDRLEDDEFEEDDYFDESLIRKESHDRYDPNIEARFIDDSGTFLRNDIPNESYFVGASKTKPRIYGTMGDTLYDEIFTFDNDFDEAWHTATVWNLRGYWVEFDRALDGDVVEKNLFKPNEMKKYLNTPLRKESRSLGGRDYTNIDPVLQEYLDFLDEAGIRVVNVVPKTKMIYVDNRGFDDAVFYMQDRDYFGKDLYSKGWTVSTQA
jgi:hypothetical protein